MKGKRFGETTSTKGKDIPRSARGVSTARKFVKRLPLTQREMKGKD